MLPRLLPAIALALPLLGCGDESTEAQTAEPTQDASSHDATTADTPNDTAKDANQTADVARDTSQIDAAPVDAPSEGSAGPTGFIGSPCSSAADCDYEDAVCLTNGFPNGMCSLPCTDSCPDQDGHPVTSCAASSAVPEVQGMGDGFCISRCDFEYFPETGCRPGYGCAAYPWGGDPSSSRFGCLPNHADELPTCYHELAARGVAFEPSTLADSHPDGYPNLTCHVEDPLYLKSPVFGVKLVSGGEETPRVLASCIMAGAVADTAEDLKPLNVVAIQHMGTYNCRVIAGTDSLSQHAGGNAIDFGGFEFQDGSVVTVVDDWEHDTDNPTTEAGQFLYDAAHRWYDQHIWNIILTPNYNDAHDNHFHVDMTEGSHFLGFPPGPPNPNGSNVD